MPSSASFFTLPFRRKKQRYQINPPDESHNVIYLGNITAMFARGDEAIEKPMREIWKSYCKRNTGDINMRLEITRSGLKAETKAQGLTEYWAHRITFCAAPPEYPKVFCWIYKHDGKRLKPEMRCHAVLCKKKEEPAILRQKLTDFLQAALQEYRREKLAAQNARAASAGSGTCPRRKQLLQTGTLNFRPPVSRSRSAPRLGSIDECIEEEEEQEEMSDTESSLGYRDEPLGETDRLSQASSSFCSSSNGSDCGPCAASADSATTTSSSVCSMEETQHRRRMLMGQLSQGSDPDSVSDESGYHDERRKEDCAPRKYREDFYSDSEVVLEEDFDDMQVTAL